MLFTESGFEADFTNHLWLVWTAGKELWQTGHPNFFLNAKGLGVFDPMFAFYGGSLYTIVGFFSQVLGGHAVIAYVGFTTIVIAGSYGSTLWLAREFGLSRWLSHVPALTVITSAYYVSVLYGRGDWAEFVATGVIPPLLASGLSICRTTTWRPRPVTLFVFCAIIFTGSHDITLVWGTTVIVVSLLLIWIGLGARRDLPYRRLLSVAALFVTCGLTNAWFLVPATLDAGKVVAHIWEGQIIATFLDAPNLLFNPLRGVPGPMPASPALYVQLQVWFIAWSIAASALVWRRGSARRLRGLWLASLVLVAALLAMLIITPFWNIVPFPLNTLQFPYRIITYIDDAVTLFVAVTIFAVEQAARADVDRRSTAWLKVTLLLVCGISTALCVWQLWVPNTQGPGSLPNRNQALASIHAAPSSWQDAGSYNDTSEPIVAVPRGRVLTINPDKVSVDHFDGLLSVPAGLAPIQTNVVGGPYLVHISGLKRVGRDASGFAVVERIANGSSPVHVTITTADAAPVEMGRWISVLALLLICLVLGKTYIRSISARWRRPTLQRG